MFFTLLEMNRYFNGLAEFITHQFSHLQSIGALDNEKLFRAKVCEKNACLFCTVFRLYSPFFIKHFNATFSWLLCCRFLQEWDPSIPGLNLTPESEGKVKDWKLLQDGQHILTTIPALVLGFRMKVYRVEGTTQWFSAVSQSFNQETRVREKRIGVTLDRIERLPWKRGPRVRSPALFLCPEFLRGRINSLMNHE